MESIGLTEAQRNRLKDLCLLYYPEYNGMIAIEWSSVIFNGNNPIHWYELVLTKLARLVIPYGIELHFYHNRILSEVHSIHPVDELWDYHITKRDGAIKTL